MIIKLLFVTSITLVTGYHYPKPNHKYHNHNHQQQTLENVFEWKQITYDFNGHLYTSDADFKNGSIISETPDATKWFIQYNNVPIGLEIYKHRVFVTVPRRRHGIPSTLNYIDLNNNKSPHLRPYPSADAEQSLVSVYRPRVDSCDRLWTVDTGLLEVPGERKQIKSPELVVFNLKTDKEIFRYTLKQSDLVDERTSAGLTSITVDVDPEDCSDAHAYITDLATNGIVVFSLKSMNSWRVSHPSFVHDPDALNFTVAGNIINWKDGVFSLALGAPKPNGFRTAFYHPLVSRKEFQISTEILKNPQYINKFENFMEVGDRGNNSQSGSHDYHKTTNNIIYANVAQNAISCWNTRKQLTPHNVEVITKDDSKLVYISDLKINGDYVYVLVNQIPTFVYSTLDTNVNNFYIHRGKIQNLIKGTQCE